MTRPGKANKQVLYVLMENMTGGFLFDWLTEDSFEPPYNLCVFKQIVQGLGHLHSNRIAHRNLQAGSIMLAGAE